MVSYVYFEDFPLKQLVTQTNIQFFAKICEH